MAKKDPKNDQSLPEQIEPKELYGRLKSLEDVMGAWYKKQASEQENKERRFRKFLIQLVIITTSAIGVIWSAVEMGFWYADVWQKRTMAERYNTVATDMYEQENNPDVALKMLEESLALNDTYETRYQIAYIKGMKAVEVLLNLDRPLNKEELNSAHSALAEAKFLIKLDDARPEGYVLESQIYVALKEYEKAKESITKALEKDPDDKFAQVRYATLLYNQEKYDDAQAVIEKLLASEPEYNWVDFLCNLFWDKQDNSEKKKKWGYFWYGMILDKQGDRAKAVAQFEEAIKLDEKFVDAHYNLGCCYLNEPRDYQKARECFEKALQYNPADYKSFYQLGMSYGYEDRYDIALTYMDKALALAPDYLTAHQWKAVVLFEMERYDEAIKSYSDAIMLDPRNAKLYIDRAESKIKVKQYDSAINDLNFALELEPQNDSAILNLCGLYMETGNTKMALERINKAIENKNDNDDNWADFLTLRAEIHQQGGNLTAAIADQKEAIEIYKNPKTLYTLALYQSQAKMNADALKTLDKLNASYPQYAPAWKLRVELLKDQDKAAALEAADRYLALQPQDVEMQKMKKELEKK
jgi:tetratricopeptide (TPR) repeat protein